MLQWSLSGRCQVHVVEVIEVAYLAAHSYQVSLIHSETHHFSGTVSLSHFLFSFLTSNFEWSVDH